jgi:putative membrane protein
MVQLRSGLLGWTLGAVLVAGSGCGTRAVAPAGEPDAAVPVDGAKLDGAADAEDGTGDDEAAVGMSILHREAIEQGQLAEARTTNAEVRGFADQVVGDHLRAEQALSALCTEQGLAPPEEGAARSPQALDAAATKRALEGLEGEAFDRAYLDAQVRLHEQLLVQLDRQFLPAVQNEALRGLLRQVRETEVAHLTLARQMQREG